ncbi:NPF8.3 [Scenedesmus sp. PABB004]|nr:NPF8.3 [Scenedesmus sp. PABB004]
MTSDGAPLVVGYLGLGIMGTAMARNLLKSGRFAKVVVWNRSSAKCAELVAEGAVAAGSPAEVVAQCDITFACMADPAAALQAALGPGGVVEGLAPGKGYVDMSTVDEETSQQIAEAVAAKGGRFLEAPVSGSKQPAVAGQLIILAAGDAALFAECGDAFGAMGKRSLFLGPVGAGARMKLVVNMVMGSMMGAFCEGLALADKAGLAQADLIEVLGLGAMANPMFALKGPGISARQYPTAFPLKHQQKDLRLALALGDSLHQALPVAAAANEAFKAAKAKGFADADFAAFQGQHPLRDRARKLATEGILIIRFEVPFNMWCGQCGEHIAKGVRFNAEKKTVGMYHSTKVLAFTMRHHCGCRITITTDPKNAEYVVTAGARRKVEAYDAADAQTVELPDAGERAAAAADPLASLEARTVSAARAAAGRASLVSLARESEARGADPYALNKQLRAAMRASKKASAAAADKRKAHGLAQHVPLLPASRSDAAVAQAVMQHSDAKFTANWQDKRRKIMTESIFGAPPAAPGAAAAAPGPGPRAAGRRSRPAPRRRQPAAAGGQRRRRRPPRSSSRRACWRASGESRPAAAAARAEAVLRHAEQQRGSSAGGNGQGAATDSGRPARAMEHSGDAIEERETRAELEKEFGIQEKAGLDYAEIPKGRKSRLAAACACILGNELCERLAYYGLQTNMGLYLKKVLGYQADQASQLLQVWKATVYLTPLLGAYLADAVMGRFWVILVFSIVYFIGMGGITLVNIIPALKPVKGGPDPPAGMNATRGAFWAFMYLTAVGSGGIKPCVSSFGGDQFNENSARERGWRSRFFNAFYFVINIGSLVAATVVVGVQESKGYGIGFGIPTLAFAVAIVAFIIGALFKLYVCIPAEGSPFTRIFRVLKGALAHRAAPRPEPADLYEPLPGTPGALQFQMAHTPRMLCLDKAALVREGAPAAASRTEVEETKAFLGIMPLFLCICIYQMTYDPIFTLLPYPGDAMDRRMGGATIPASTISFANTFGVLFTVVFYDVVVVPLTNKIGRPISMTMRIGIGFFVQILALVSAALIEMARYRLVKRVGLIARFEAAGPDADPLAPEFVQPMSIWWQFIPYFLLGASEVFTNIGTMELFYTQVSEGMRSLGTSVYLLTVAVGTYLASALNIIVAAASPVDLWVSDNSLFGHYDWYFWLNAGIIAVGLVLYTLVARRYVEKPVLESDKDPFNTESRLHSELGNVSKAWPSVRKSSRMSELRMRSRASMTSAGSGLAPADAAARKDLHAVKELDA